jgi:bifunctional non-homologous end joining protein LigD
MTFSSATGHILSKVPEKEHIVLDLDGHEVRFTSPSKVYFPKHGYTKKDLLDYYLSVAEPCIRHLRDRPTTMKRWRKGRARKG